MTFVDTNVLVYATAIGAPLQARSRAALGELVSRQQRSISRQVLREYIAVMTRPQTWAKALSLAEAVADAEAFLRGFALLEDGPSVWAELRALSVGYSFAGRQVHDANIVATMLAHRERRLLTFNEADFHRFGAVIDIVVP